MHHLTLLAPSAELVNLGQTGFGIRVTAAPLIRFAALFGIISLVGYRWSAAQSAAHHCRVSGARVETM